MFCTSCGNKIDDDMIFCPNCGAQQPRKAVKAAPAQQLYRSQPEPIQPPEPVKSAARPSNYRRGIPGWLMLIIGFVAAAAVAAGLILGGVIGGSGTAVAGKIEGRGFNTPEEAVMAYAEALKAQDYDRMLSTFAVETFCENYDSQNLLERVLYYNISFYNVYPIAPTEDSLIGKLNIEKRRNSIVSLINYQILQLANANTNGALNDVTTSNSITFDKGDKGKRDISYLLQDLQDLPDLSKMEIGDIVYGEVIDSRYLDCRNIQNMIKQAETYGADGYKSLAITFTVDGLEGAIFMDTVCYDGRWYNLTPQGNLGAIMGVAVTTGGMVVTADRTLYREYHVLIDDQEELLDQWRSELRDLEQDWEDNNELSMSFDEMTDFMSLTELLD